MVQYASPACKRNETERTINCTATDAAAYVNVRLFHISIPEPVDNCHKGRVDKAQEQAYNVSELYCGLMNNFIAYQLNYTPREL